MKDFFNRRWPVRVEKIPDGNGSFYIGFSEGGEAANPFAPNYKPLDAYNACILDTIEVE